MFSTLWKCLSDEDEQQLSRYTDQLKRLVSYFPIGSKINYYPEYLEDITFETIVLGYALNDTSIYTREHVRELNDTLNFYSEETGETIVPAELASFSLIVPDTSEMEKTLDYNSLAMIGRSGQFVRGNCITLLSTATEQGTPTIDTTVLRRTKVKQGYYQNYKVVELDPDLETMTFKEYRQQNRMELSLPCTLSTSMDGQSELSGTLIDCSEFCIGVKTAISQADDAPMTEGMIVQICIPMPVLDRTFDLQGSISAIRTNGTVVLKLQGIKKADEYKELQLVDRLDIRAAFVQCCLERRAPDGGIESSFD